jgi:hypothetical protein
MTPLKRILAALDRSTVANDVFAQAIARAQQNNSHLMLLHQVNSQLAQSMWNLHGSTVIPA